MKVIYYIFVSIATMLSALVIFSQVTGLIGRIHLIVAGVFFGVVFLIGLLAHFITKRMNNKTTTGRIASSGKSSEPDNYAKVLNDTNRLLNSVPAYNMIAIPSVRRQLKKEFVHKKTQDLVEYWGIVAETKTGREPVRIIYNADKDDIEDYEKNPPAYRRDDPFEDFDPQKLTRVMSNKYKDEEDDKDEQNLDFELSASAKQKGNDDEQ